MDNLIFIDMLLDMVCAKNHSQSVLEVIVGGPEAAFVHVSTKY